MKKGRNNVTDSAAAAAHFNTLHLQKKKKNTIQYFILTFFFLPVLKRGKPKKGKNDLISAEEGDDPFADISSVGMSLSLSFHSFLNT